MPNDMFPYGMDAAVVLGLGILGGALLFALMG